MQGFISEKGDSVFLFSDIHNSTKAVVTALIVHCTKKAFSISHGYIR